MSGPLVKVTWLDAIGHGRWEDEAEILRALAPAKLLHRSVGWVLRDDADGLLICASRSEEEPGVWADCTLIPRPAVLGILPLEDGR